jgi:hypothetical protein
MTRKLCAQPSVRPFFNRAHSVTGAHLDGTVDVLLTKNLSVNNIYVQIDLSERHD